MNAKTAASLALALALPLTLGAQQAMAEKAGVAAAVNPDAEGTPPGEQTHYLKLGLDVPRNEHIVTSDKGLTQLLFNDGSTLSLGPSADVTIDEFVYNPSTGTGKMALTLGKGVMRLVGGQIANSSDVAVKTPAATIGIRGAIGGVAVDGDGTTAYMAYGHNMTVTGQSGPPQTVTHGNMAITVQHGGPASPPMPLTQSLLQKVAGALEPPANGGGGGAKSAPTEQSVQSSTSSGSPLAAPPPPAPPPPPQPTNSVNNYTQVAQGAAQQKTVTAALTGSSTPTLTPNTDYGPYLFNSYRFLQTTGFSTDANGYMVSLNNGPISFADPLAAMYSDTTIPSTDHAIGTPTNVVSIGLAQIGIWQGDVFTGEIQDPSTGVYSPGTVTNNLPSAYFIAVPTTTLPQSGHYVYSLAASTPLVSSRTDPTGVSTGGILAGSRLANSTLSADFGYGGPNSAQLTFNADLIIPGDGTLRISDRMVNYPLTRFFFFTSNGSTGTVTPLSASSYCNSSTVCSLTTQGYFSGAAGLAQIALGYFVTYSDIDDYGYGSVTGSAIYQFNSSVSGPSGPSSVGFFPGSTVAAVLIRSQAANNSVTNFDIVDTGADGIPNSLSYVPAVGGQVAEQGGDAYVQARRLTGMLSSFGSTYSAAAGGLHEIYGIPTVTLPTSGTISYDLLFATSPTYGDNYGGPGHFSSGALLATFTPTGINITTPQMVVAMSDATYTTRPTTITNVTSPIFAGTAQVTSTPPYNHLCGECDPSYIANLKGLFAGPGALRAALLYAISNGGYGVAINGAAVFRH